MITVIDLTSLADNFSGIERYALNITCGILEQDKENQYILYFKNEIHERMRPFIKQKNILVRILKGRNKLIFNQLILPFALYKAKANCFLFLAFPVPVIYFRKNIVFTVFDMVCWDVPQTMTFLSKWYFRISIRTSLWKARNIISISDFTTERLLAKFHVKRDKVEKIYCGISSIFTCSGEDSREVYEKYRLPREYLLCLSTLEPRKNLKLLMRAYIELIKEGTISVDLVLAGKKGWKSDDLFEEIPKEYKDKIHFTGFIEDNDLPLLYQYAKCFVFPSYYEGFGIPPLEALAMETIVIASDSAAMSEVLEKAVLYFENNNLSSLKEKLVYVCNEMPEQEKQRRCQEGKIQAGKFSWNAEAEKLNRLIRSYCE